MFFTVTLYIWKYVPAVAVIDDSDGFGKVIKSFIRAELPKCISHETKQSNNNVETIGRAPFS